MKTVIYIYIAFLLCCCQAQAQNRNVSKSGTTAAVFLEIPVGARAIGMGGAYVSIADDATATYWNAAGIARAEANMVSVVHTEWLADTKFDHASVVFGLGSIGVLGFSYTSLSMPDMIVRTVEKPEGTGERFSAGDISVGVSYARDVTDRFSIGFTAKYIQQTIWHETASGFAIDAGTIFRTDLLNGLVIGASISNFGTSMQLDGRDTRSFGRIDDTKQGSNERIPFNIELESWDLPLLFQIGLSTSLIKDKNYNILVAVDALHPNDNYESVNLGTEISFMQVFFLRAGFNSLLLKDREGGLTLGVGLETGRLFNNTSVGFDYAYRDFGRLKNIHVFDVNMKF
ncbi:MAG: PorV/PorQ family protein [Bacteroidota bacterium]